MLLFLDVYLRLGEVLLGFDLYLDDFGLGVLGVVVVVVRVRVFRVVGQGGVLLRRLVLEVRDLMG